MWPLVGRDRLRAMLTQVVGTGSAALVRGRPGIGKTRLLEEVVAGATGHDAIWVRGVESTASLPLAPLLSVLSGEELARRSVGEVARVAMGQIYRRAAAGPVLLVVDDAHLVSDEVAVVVHQAQTNGPVSCLVASRDGAPLPGALRALARRDSTEVTELGPLTFDATVTLVEHVLGGQLAPSAAATLHTLSDGHPLHLRELVTSALERGSLEPDDHGMWHVAGDLVSHARIEMLVADRLRMLGAAELRVLAAAALQPLPHDLLLRIAGEEVVREVVARGVLTVVEDGRRLMARPDHALLGEVALTMLDPAQRRDLLGEISREWWSTGTRRSDDLAIVAELELAAGLHPAPDLLVAAAQVPGVDPARAVELARMAVEADGGVEATVALGRALAASSSWSEAAATFEDALVTSRGAVRASVASAYLRAAVDHLVDADAVVDLARRLSDAIDDPGLVVTRLTAELFVRPLAQSADAARAALHRPDLDPAHSTGARFVLATALSHAGELDESVRLAREVVASGGLDRLDEARALSVAGESMAYRGELGAAIESAEAELEEARREGEIDREMLARHILLVALVLAGRCADAARHGRRNRRLLRLGADLRTAPSVHIDLLLALSRLRGAHDEAQEALGEARRFPAVARYVWESELLLGASRLSACDDERNGLLELAADAARERGARPMLARVLHERAMVDRPAPVLEELREVAASTGGLTSLWFDHAVAIVRCDVEGLAAVSLRAEAIGDVSCAVEAATTASRAAVRAHPGTAHVLASRARRLQSLIPDTLPFSAPPRDLLTKREEEFVAAVSGASDKELASRANVSLRTVQGHLHRAYRKLAVGGRSELAALTERHDPSVVDTAG